MRLDDLPESWTREPFHHDFPEHPKVTDPAWDDPGTVRVVDIPEVVRFSDSETSNPPGDDGARLRGKPWEEEAREDFDRALTAAWQMREAAEAFVGWITRAAPLIAPEYDHLLEEADARINRIQRMAGQQ
jgi:hypothetical protein